MVRLLHKKKWLLLAFVFAAPFIGAISMYFLVINSDIQEDLKTQKDEGAEDVRNYNEQIGIEPRNEQYVTLGQDDMQTAMDVATEFALRFHVIDEKDPYKYVNEAKPYMTDEMYEAYKNVPKRATLAAVEEKIVGVEIWPHDLLKGQQIYQVDVFSESKSIDGEITPSFTGYLISLKEVQGEWKVNGVNVNGG